MRPVAVNGEGQQMGIVATAPCGCVQGLALDVPGDMEIVRQLKAWRRMGWALERLPLGAMPRITPYCPHRKEGKPRKPGVADPVLVRK